MVNPEMHGARISILGIGPILAVAGAAAAAIVYSCARYTGIGLHVPDPWRMWTEGCGILLSGIGLVFWIGSAVQIKRQFIRHELATGGMFAYSRNPMYAAFIVFLLPGVSFLANELTLLVIPLSMFIVFKRNIGKEEDFLTREFGPAFAQYRMETPQLFPRIRRPR